MTSPKYSVNIDTVNELNDLLEDTIAYFCQENMVSGEMAWILTETVATAKIEDFKGNLS